MAPADADEVLHLWWPCEHGKGVEKALRELGLFQSQKDLGTLTSCRI